MSWFRLSIIISLLGFFNDAFRKSFLPPTWIACIPVRYIVSILGSIAMAIIYGLKVNLSVAIVAMVNHTAIKAMSDHSHEDDSLNNITTITRVECSAPNVSAAEAAENHVSQTNNFHSITILAINFILFSINKLISCLLATFIVWLWKCQLGWPLRLDFSRSGNDSGLLLRGLLNFSSKIPHDSWWC